MRLTRNGAEKHVDDQYIIVPPSECHCLLWETLESVEGATVGTLMDILSSDVDFYSRLFDAPFLESYIFEGPSDEGASGIKSVEFSWAMEKWSGKHWHEDGEIEMYVDCHGVGPYADPNFPGRPEVDEHWALDFSPIADILDKPIAINNLLEVHKYSHNGDHDGLQLGRFRMRLIDVLGALMEEASFNGSPSDRKELWDEITETSKQLDDDLARGDMSKYKTLDDIEKELGLDDDDGLPDA